MIDDDGRDFLGRGRFNLTPEETLRGRSFLRHRQQWGNGWETIAELGYISDRDFLEQFFEEEWDRDRVPHTGLRLRRTQGSQLLDLAINARVNDFFQETERLPSLHYYGIGASIFERLTWSVHHEASYKRLKVADAPINPAVAAQTATLPGEVDREGLVARTRQEISAPLDLGPFRFVPFAIGEAAYYGEGTDGQEVTRLWAGGGIRANLPFVRVDPSIQSALLNIRGIAHKGSFNAEYFYADSDTDLDDLPLYEPLDDDAQEQFRRFFTFNTFGGTLPAQFEPRTYALRHGIQRHVTSPSDTVVDDLQQLRLGLDNRWETKRGLPGRDRIVDLFRFNIDTLLFPNADDDNFGETIGPTWYEAQYNLGDRFALLSDGYADFFDEGLRTVSAGIRTSRPGQGDAYVGLLSIEGPISATVLRASLDYRLNEKWIFSGGSTYDFGEVGSVGQSFGLTRIGESFLVQVGGTADFGRDNVSIGFKVEPRFLPSELGRLGGIFVPPTGFDGLE